MNEKPKTYCAKCDCMVVPDGHEQRCRPKSVRGWSDMRRAAWIGDMVHCMDVQLAVQLMGVQPGCWEQDVQRYTSNAAQANYLLQFGIEYGYDVSSEGRSTHAVGTEFEARYAGQFRSDYLRRQFPGVASQVEGLWRPPPLVNSFPSVGGVKIPGVVPGVDISSEESPRCDVK